MEGAILPSSGLVEGEDDLVRMADAQLVVGPLCRHMRAMLRKESEPG